MVLIGSCSITEHTFCAVLELVVVANLTEATRQRRTFDAAAIFECKRLKGAGVAHLEVLCDFLQEHLIAAY